MIRAKVKLACSGCEDPNFSKFLDGALENPHHKSLLESEYSAELALYSIVKDNMDRARYYSNVSLQTFLRVSRAEWVEIGRRRDGGGRERCRGERVLKFSIL